MSTAVLHFSSHLGETVHSGGSVLLPATEASSLRLLWDQYLSQIQQRQGTPLGAAINGDAQSGEGGALVSPRSHTRLAAFASQSRPTTAPGGSISCMPRYPGRGGDSNAAAPPIGSWLCLLLCLCSRARVAPRAAATALHLWAALDPMEVARGTRTRVVLAAGCIRLAANEAGRPRAVVSVDGSAENDRGAAHAGFPWPHPRGGAGHASINDPVSLRLSTDPLIVRASVGRDEIFTAGRTVRSALQRGPYGAVGAALMITPPPQWAMIEALLSCEPVLCAMQRGCGLQRQELAWCIRQGMRPSDVNATFDAQWRELRGTGCTPTPPPPALDMRALSTAVFCTTRTSAMLPTGQTASAAGVRTTEEQGECAASAPTSRGGGHCSGGGSIARRATAATVAVGAWPDDGVFTRYPSALFRPASSAVALDADATVGQQAAPATTTTTTAIHQQFHSPSNGPTDSIPLPQRRCRSETAAPRGERDTRAPGAPPSPASSRPAPPPPTLGDALEATTAFAEIFCPDAAAYARVARAARRRSFRCEAAASRLLQLVVLRAAEGDATWAEALDAPELPLAIVCVTARIAPGVLAAMLHLPPATAESTPTVPSSSSSSSPPPGLPPVSVTGEGGVSRRGTPATQINETARPLPLPSSSPLNGEMKTEEAPTLVGPTLVSLLAMTSRLQILLQA